MEHTQALVEVTCTVSRYVDRAEHAESPTLVFTQVGEYLRTQAVTLTAELGGNLPEIYATRLACLRERGAVHRPGACSGSLTVLGAANWRDWQLVQIEHELDCQPDLFEMSKLDQARHHAFTLSSLSQLAFEASHDKARQSIYIRKYIADVLILGLRFAALDDQRLPKLPVLCNREHKVTVHAHQDPFASR
jgi:hypothetical protein